jgi:hypothetical protein
MSDFTEIINECLAVSAEDFPADRDDVKTWHFTDMQIRHLLASRWRSASRRRCWTR